jgi:acetyl-CoA acetyltransferase family protein
MTAVFAVDACRTPVGKIKGSLASVRPDHLTAEVIKALVARNGWLDPARIDDVYWGAANQAGEDNRNVARMGVLLAGLPVEVPGATVNRLCGSGMEAIASAARAIAAGEADIMLAGGAESMTRAPFVLPRASDPFPREAGMADTRLGWRLVSPLMQELYPPITLGETAENVAERYGVSRERQDEFALRSHQRAGAAQQAGRFDDEIVPVLTAAGPVGQDEGIRPGLTLEELAAKRPAFRKGGTVTGGNSSPLNDGAAGVLLVSERVLAGGATPLARYEGTAAAGVHPDYMGIGPVPAMGKVLGRAGWDVRRLDLVELNEAFAAQAVAVADELKLDPEQPSGWPRDPPLRRRHVHRGRAGYRHPLAGTLRQAVACRPRVPDRLRVPGRPG